MKKVHLVVIGIFAAIFLTLGCTQISDKPDAPPSGISISPPPQEKPSYNETINTKKVPVIVYMDNSQRVFQKRGNANPDVNTYEGIGLPLSILPTNKNVSAFYDGKFVPLEIAKKNKETIDYFRKQSRVLYMFLTNNKKQMIVSVSNEKEGTALYSYDFDKKTAKQLYDSKSFSFDSTAAFNEEKNILFGFLAKGEGGSPVGFNLNTGETKPVPGYGLNIGYNFSPNGKYLFFEYKRSPDKCSMLGQASMYSIIDPITGKKYGKFGKEDKYVRIEALSPDSGELIYSVREPSSSTKCDELNIKKIYYRVSLDQPQKGTEINNYKSVLSQWNSTEFVAETAPDHSEQIFSNDGKLLFTIPKDYQIVAAYYDD